MEELKPGNRVRYDCNPTGQMTGSRDYHGEEGTVIRQRGHMVDVEWDTGRYGIGHGRVYIVPIDDTRDGEPIIMPYGLLDDRTRVSLDGLTKIEPEPEEVPVRTVRSEVLDEAKRITATDRNSSYGEPEDNFQRIADYWTLWLKDRLKDGEEITAGDTAAMQIFVKMAREMNAPTLDNKVDLAGYAACWAEVDAKKEQS